MGRTPHPQPYGRHTEEDRGHETPCWVWTGPTSRGRNGRGKPYGKSSFGDGKHQYAHRAYYERHTGPIPEGMHIDHLCRETLCVNPDHLEAVTVTENNRRAAKHQAYTRKLPPARERELIRRFRSLWKSPADGRSERNAVTKLAEAFGVSTAYIRFINKHPDYANGL